VLDFEGNNVKDLDQLYYLKRCRKLAHVNLKYNPVASGRAIGSAKGTEASKQDLLQEYYTKISENVPLIEELDDQEVTTKFFADKIAEISAQETGKQKGMLQLPMYQRFVSLGVSAETMETLNGPDILKLDEEQDDEVLLVTTIKN